MIGGAMRSAPAGSWVRGEFAHGLRDRLSRYIDKLDMPGEHVKGRARLAYAYRLWLKKQNAGGPSESLEHRYAGEFSEWSPARRYRASCCMRLTRGWFSSEGEARGHLTTIRHVAAHRRLNEDKLRRFIRKWYPVHKTLAAIDGVDL